MTLTAEAGTVRRPRQESAGPALISSAVATIAPFMLSLLVGLVAAGKVYSSPFASDATLRTYFVDHHTAIAVVAFLQLVSAVGLGLFTCVLWARLRALAAGGPAVYAVAVGGAVAAALLAVNAVIQWVLSHTEVALQQPLVRALNYLFWTLGGPAHTAWLGLLVGGASIAALRFDLLPRWLGIAGLVVAALGELSLLTLLTQSVVAFIPLGRFPAFAWMVTASVLLSRTRARPGLNARFAGELR
jgi:hypothetical protein